MREGWIYKKLKDIGVVVTGNTPSTKDKENYSSDDYCFVKPSDIAKDGVSIIKDSESYISEKGYNSSRKLPKGSVLTTCIGIIGKVGILEIDATCNQQINAIIPSRTILPKYLALAILSVRSQLEAMANAPVVPIINKGVFSNVEIPVPSFEEQKRIVEELDLLTEIIDKQKQQLKELDTLAQSIFYDMFGNPVENEKGWIVRKLGDVCGFVNGFAFKSEKFKKEGLPVLRISNIQNDIVKEDDMVYFSPSDYKEDFSKYQVVKGDIVIAMSGATTGKLGVHIGSSTYYLNQRVGKFLPSKTTLNKSYLLYYLKSMSAQILNDAMGVAQPNISSGQIKGYDILVPPMDAQISFATIINTIASQKQSINRSIAESQKLFDYTMDKYFG